MINWVEITASLILQIRKCPVFLKIKIAEDAGHATEVAILWPAPHFIRQVMLSARLSEIQTECFQLAVLDQGHAQRAVQVGGCSYTKS